MFNKILNAIEPFGLCLILLAGASLAGWLSFTNTGIVGVVTVFIGFIFVVRYFVNQISDNKNI